MPSLTLPTVGKELQNICVNKLGHTFSERLHQEIHYEINALFYKWDLKFQGFCFYTNFENDGLTGQAIFIDIYHISLDQFDDVAWLGIMFTSNGAEFTNVPYHKLALKQSTKAIGNA